MRHHPTSSCGSPHGIGHLEIIIPMIIIMYQILPLIILFNTFVEFRSRKPGMANVDWGDGIKEQFPMTVGSRAG